MIITAYRQLTKQEASGGPGFIPAVADCRYRAPLSPRLVRPCPTPQAASGRLLVYIIQHFPSRIKRLTIKFLYSFSEKGFTFLKFCYTIKLNGKSGNPAHSLRSPFGPVAQLGERSVRIREVEGSNPFGSTIARRYKLCIVRNVFGLTIKIEDR